MSKVRQKRRTLNQSDKEEIGLQCCNCGSTSDLQYHHIIPIAIGGKDINSNMCCLCYSCHYKLHHNGNKAKINNYSELIKTGQAKAKANGKLTGQQGNIITIIKNDGSKYEGTAKQLSEIFKRDKRTIELWAKVGIFEGAKKKLNIQKVYYSKIKHPHTKNIKNTIDINIKIHNNKKAISINNQLTFF